MKTFLHRTKRIGIPGAGPDSVTMPRKCCAIPQARQARLNRITGALVVETLARIDCNAQPIAPRVRGDVKPYQLPARAAGLQQSKLK